VRWSKNPYGKIACRATNYILDCHYEKTEYLNPMAHTSLSAMGLVLQPLHPSHVKGLQVMKERW
jgi:hypothetical protein